MDKIYNTLLLEENPPVLRVTLNRPERANAFNTEMIGELTDLFTRLRGETGIRYVVFTGRGNIFSSGVDLVEAYSELQAGDSPHEKGRLGQLECHEFMKKLENLEQVTFAALNGPVYGAGFALSMACDFRVLADHAVMCIPEAKVGIFFTWGCTPRLVSMVGSAKAKELIMLCSEVDAPEALRLGLVNRVVPAGELFAEVDRMIGAIEGMGRLAVRMTKKIANAAAAPNFGDLYICEPELLERVVLSGEPAEKIREFWEKRVKQAGNKD